MRSVHHGGAAVHDAGWQMMQTGRLFTGGVNTPHIGSAVGYLRRPQDRPAAVRGAARADGPGRRQPAQRPGRRLPRQGTRSVRAQRRSLASPASACPTCCLPRRSASVRLDRRRKIRELVDDAVATFEASENAALLDGNFHSAFRLMTSPQAREAFDLSQESTVTRERYGMTRLGQCCLLARRLIEGGVRFVTINAFLTVFDEITWDIHGSKPFTSIEGMRDIVCPMYDQAYTALLEDLAQRGMLDSTLVCNLAEFGRTPRVNPAGGRDHWPLCYTVAFAGGGVKGAGLSGPATRSAPCPPTGPSSRPTSPRRSSTAWASTSKPTSPGRPAGRSRWSTSDIAKSKSSSEPTGEPQTTASRSSPVARSFARLSPPVDEVLRS